MRARTPARTVEASEDLIGGANGVWAVGCGSKLGGWLRHAGVRARGDECAGACGGAGERTVKTIPPLLMRPPRGAPPLRPRAAPASTRCAESERARR